MSKRILANKPAPTEGRKIPASVSLPDFIEALRPAMALVGLAPEEVLADRFSISADEITFLSGVPIDGVEPVASGAESDFDGVWVWPATIVVRRP